MKNREFLIDYLEHISYEIEGIISSYLQMTKLESRGNSHPLGSQGQQNDCLDLMALHFRNLYEFFCYAPKNGYIRAADYANGFAGTANPRLIEKANNQTSHLTEKRHEIAQDSVEKPWDPNEVLSWVFEQLDKWKVALSNGYSEELQRRLSLVQPFIDIYKKKINEGIV